MAVSFINPATASNAAGGTITNIVVNVPTNTQNGDLILAVVYHNQNTLTAPGGWTQLGVTEDAGANIRSSVWYRVASSEPASYTWTISSAGIAGAGHFTFRGVNTGSAPAIAQGDRTTADPFTAPSVSLSGSGVVVTCGGSRGSTTTEITHSSASGDTEADDWGNDGGASTRNGFCYYSGTLSSGSYGRQVNIDTGTITEGTSFSVALEESAATNASAGAVSVTATANQPTVTTSGGTQAPAGAVTSVATANQASVTITEPTARNPEPAVPTYEIYIDWDNDGLLDIGNFDLNEDDWVSNGAPIVAVSSVRAHLGTQSLLVTWTGAAGQAVEKAVSGLISGRSYTFSAWVFVGSGDQAVRLEVDGVATGSASSTTNAWQKITVAFTATSTEHTLRLEPSATPTNGDVVYMDQVMVFGAGEDVSARVLGVRAGIDFAYGRDTARSLAQFQPGETTLTINNESRDYSPDNTGSPLYGYVVPGRNLLIRATYNDLSHTLFFGFVDDYVLNPAVDERSLEITALDVMQKLNEAAISTELHRSLQTGEAIHKILDAVSWPVNRRDIDHGASTLPWWWVEEADAFEALNQIVASEGPPAIAYVDPHGNFVFRDRHHRLIREPSKTVQASFLGGGEDISFVAAGTAYSDTASGTSYTLNKPLGVQVEDLMIAFVFSDQVATNSEPAGWTEVRTITLNDGTDDLFLSVLIKDVAVDDPSSWAGSISVASTRRYARVLAYRGTAPAAEQFIDEDQSTSTGTSNTVTTATVSGGQPGNWRIGAFLIHDDSTAGTGWGTYTPTGTERFDVELGGADPVLYLSVADSNDHVAVTADKQMSATLAGVTTVDSSASWIGIIRPYEGQGLRFENEGFEYDIGWKDIVNSVSITLEEREPTFLQTVFESEELLVIPGSSSREVTVEAEEIFYNAVIPEEDIDYTLLEGTVTASLSRTSGESCTITLQAGANQAVVSGLKLRAVPVPVQREFVVKVEDTSSIANHGIHSLEEEIETPFINRNDAEAIAKTILSLRAERLPLITFKVTNSNDLKTTQILSRDLSDRIHIVEGETFTDHDFFIERIEQAIEDVGHNHSALFGCERERVQVQNVFKFGAAGPGFDDGRLGLLGADDADTVMILGQGTLDTHVLGT